MELFEYLQHLYDYNAWANQQAIAAAEGLSDEQLHRAQGHSWGSVHGVLLHMLNAEWIWLQRWQGNSPEAFLTVEEFPTLTAIQIRWNSLEAELRSFLHQQTAESLQSEIAYTNTRGETFHLPLWQMVVHVANHNTHHRGELAAMFALLNTPHAEEDWLHYFLHQTGQR